MQLAEAIESYLRSVKIYMAEGSVKAYRLRLNILRDTLGDVPFEHITRNDLEKLVLAYRRGRQPATVRLLVTAIKGVFAWGVEENHIHHSPAARLKAPPRGVQLPRGLSQSLRQKVTDVCMDALTSENFHDVRNATLILTLRYAGLRRAEARDMTWKDIHDDILIVKGKGNKQRMVPLYRSVQTALTRWAILGGRKGVVFSREDGHKLSLTAINQVIFNGWLCPQIGEHISPHQLRHTVATELVEKGASLDEVAGLLGHESVSTTQIYVSCSVERIRRAVNLFDEV